MAAKERRPFLFLFYLLWTGFCRLSNFLYFFFSWLTINHKHKCIQAKTFETQVDLLTHVLINDITEARVLVRMTKKKLRKT